MEGRAARVEWITPILEVLRGGSPWLLLVATWIGGASMLVRALVTGKLYTRGQYQDVVRQVDLWVARCERWEAVALTSARLAEKAIDVTPAVKGSSE